MPRRVSYRRGRHGIGLGAIAGIASAVAKPVANIAKKTGGAIHKAIHNGHVNDYKKGWEWLIKDHKAGKKVNKKNIKRIKRGREAANRAETALRTGQEINGEDWDYYMARENMKKDLKTRRRINKIKRIKELTGHGRRRRK